MKVLLSLILFLSVFASAGDKLKINFVDENDTLFKNGKFYLYEYKNGEFHKAHFRGHQIEGGVIVIDSLPEVGTIGFTSKDKYYTKFIDYKKPQEITKGKKDLKIKIQQSGIIKVTMTPKAFKTSGPFVVPFYLHANGKVKRLGGIGVFLSPKDSFEIDGLKAGKYHIEIRDSYKDTATSFYKSSIIDVIAGKTFSIKGVELNQLKKFKNQGF